MRKVYTHDTIEELGAADCVATPGRSVVKHVWMRDWKHHHGTCAVVRLYIACVLLITELYALTLRRFFLLFFLFNNSLQASSVLKGTYAAGLSSS